MSEWQHGHRLTACAAAGTGSARLGEGTTKRLEVTPRRWIVVQYFYDKFTCHDLDRVSQAPSPFHSTASGWADPSLLAMIMFEKFSQHQPLNR